MGEKHVAELSGGENKARREDDGFRGWKGPLHEGGDGLHSGTGTSWPTEGAGKEHSGQRAAGEVQIEDGDSELRTDQGQGQGRSVRPAYLAAQPFPRAETREGCCVLFVRGPVSKPGRTRCDHGG